MTSLQPWRTSSLINAYHNQPSFLWDVNMNASEKRRARLSTMLNTSAGTVRMYDMRQIMSIGLSKCCGFSGLVNTTQVIRIWAQKEVFIMVFTAIVRKTGHVAKYFPEIANSSATCTTNLRQICGKPTTNRSAVQQIHNKSICCGFAVQQIYN